MDNIWIVIIIALASYLIGSISFTRMIAKKANPNADLENVYIEDKKTAKKHRLRTVSATTASIELGPKVGGTITLLDTLKGALPVLAVRLLFPNTYYHLVAGLFVVVGHDWSIFNRFTGGGGLSSTNGVFLVVDWIGAIVCSFLGMGIGFMVLKDMFFGFILSPWLMVVWMLIFKRDWYHVSFALILNVIILLKLSPDIIDYLKYNKDGGVDYSSIMDQTGMGRGMKKIMKFLGIKPDK